MKPCLLALALFLWPASGHSQSNPCVDCHAKITPAVVEDWQLSRHSKEGVTCDECHGDAHKSADDAAKAQIPTPETCAPCHEERVAQFKKGKHAFAWAAMN